MNDGKFTIGIVEKGTNKIITLGGETCFFDPSTMRLALVKMSNGEPIPEEEPVHVFRARDKYAIPALYFYRQFGIKKGCNDYHEAGINAQIERFEKFEEEHSDRMKIPGITRGL